MKLRDLAPNPANPRKIDQEHLKMLKKSLDEYGDLSGFVFNETSRQLVGGHRRGEVLPPDADIIIEERYATPTRTGTTAEGYVIVDGERFSYRQVRWDAAREKAANIAANKHGGEWDNAKLADWLIELDSMNLDTDLIGFTSEEIEDICAPFRTMPDEDADAVPEPPKVAKTKTSELWLLGDHRLLVGDCTVKENVERLMNGEKADMVFTDPPYGVNYDGGHANEKRREKLQGDEDTELYPPTCLTAFEYSKHDSALHLWHAGVKGLKAAAAAAGWEIRAEIIWNKNLAQFGAISAQYKQKHEPAYYCYKRGKTVNWNGPTNEVTVWDCNRSSVNEFHPTQKPVELAERAIRNHTVKSVLDLFLGSGSTLIACEKTGRKCYGMEIDPVYCDVILDRWTKFSGKTAHREDGTPWEYVRDGGD